MLFRSVGIATEIPEALRREGLARELVHKVQTQRKESGFEIEDTISCDISGSSLLIDVAREHEEFFKAETLCRQLSFGEGPLPGSVTADSAIDGEKIEVSIARLGSVND